MAWRLVHYVVWPLAVLAWICTFAITVSDAAYSAPNFPPKFVSTDGSTTPSEIIVHVKEGPADVGKEIVRLAGKDADVGDTLTFGALGTIASDIIRVENVPESNAAIVYLRKELDRETRDSYTVVLTLTDGKLGKGNFITKTMLIIVEDNNDNEPVFKPFRTTVRVSEDARPGVIETVEAFDTDEGSFGQVLYKLEEVDRDPGALPSFAIETQQAKGVITLIDKLDYEKKSFHQLKILACDRAPEGQRKTATAMLLVKVEDAEDEPPIFTSVPPVTRVPENLAVGSQVLKVAAVDGDRGVNNPINYRISKGARGLFVINASNGVVSLNKTLDREDPSGSAAYVLEVVATEVTNSRVRPPPSVSAEVIIEIKDTNDNSPVFAKKIFAGGVTTAHDFGSVVMHVKATDADAGLNSVVSYFIVGPIKNKLSVGLDAIRQEPFIINKKTGDISLNFHPRKDMKGHFEFRVLANDTYGLLDTATVFVYLLNEDQRVRFVLRLAPLELREKLEKFVDVMGNITGAVVNVDSYKYFTNEDGTVDKQRTVMYLHFVNPADNAVMEVDAVLGLLDKNNKFLGELYQEFHVLLEESFNSPPKFVSTDGSAMASDVIVRVKEGPADLGKMIYYLAGKDPDGDPLTFGVSGTIAEDIIRVENVPVNGAIVYLRRELDRETRDSYTVVLTLTDGKLGKGKFVTMTMTIIVEDSNDNEPVFKPFRTTVTLSEDSMPGVVESVEAFDPDEGSFGQVLYKLVEVDKDASSPATFAIETHQAKGIISLVDKLDYEKKSFHQLKILACDRAPEGQRKTATAMLLVKVEDAEDEPPIFTLVPSVTRVPENTAIGSQVLRVAAVDGDRGVNNPINYRISKGARELFVIDSANGVVSLNKTLDREDPSGSAAYVLEVVATEVTNSRVRPPPSVSAEVIIEIKDTNDNSPVFSKKVFTGGVTTAHDFGSVFMHVKATDADAGLNSVISYFIVGPTKNKLSVGLDGVRQEPFLINRKTGDISLNLHPRKDMKGHFEFRVLANDTYGLLDTATVFVYLLNEDQRVRFVLRLAPLELREKLDKFVDVLGNITGAVVNVDSYKYFANEDGTVDKQRTVMYLHFVNPADNVVMEVDAVLSMLDKNNKFLSELYQEFHLLLGEPSVGAEVYLTWDDQVKTCLVGSTAFLSLLLVLVICLCLNQKSRYKRQLKAATASSYGPRDAQLSRANVPNTNIHADEGSNPIWMTGYDNEWYDKDEEQLSSGSGASSATGNSLDENAVVGEVTTTEPTTPTDSLNGSGRGSNTSISDRQALCRGIGGRLTPNNVLSQKQQRALQGKKPAAPKPPTPLTPGGKSPAANGHEVTCKNSVNTIYISSSYPNNQAPPTHYHHHPHQMGNNLSIISLETTEL